MIDRGSRPVAAMLLGTSAFFLGTYAALAAAWWWFPRVQDRLKLWVERTAKRKALLPPAELAKFEGRLKKVAKDQDSSREPDGFSGGPPAPAEPAKAADAEAGMRDSPKGLMERAEESNVGEWLHCRPEIGKTGRSWEGPRRSSIPRRFPFFRGRLAPGGAAARCGHRADRSTTDRRTAGRAFARRANRRISRSLLSPAHCKEFATVRSRLASSACRISRVAPGSRRCADEPDNVRDRPPASDLRM